MASHRRVRNEPSRLRTAALTAAAIAAAVTPGVTAAPPAAADPGVDASTVRQQVADLYQQAEAATEAYDATQERITRLEAAVAGEGARAALLRDQLTSASARLGLLAAQQYRASGVNPALALMFATHPDTYLERVGINDRYSDLESRRVAEVRAEQRQLADLDKCADRELANLDAARRELAAHRSDVEARLSAAQARLHSLGEARRSQVLAALAGTDGTVAGGGLSTAVPTLDALLGAVRSTAAELPDGTIDVNRTTEAIGAAYAELGKPYVWGATGPDQFDCSGFTQHVWGQAGVQLPRTSQEQANAGTIVPIADVRPGDLVVYFPGHTHVALYVGQGMVIHAPHPGTVVRFAPLAAMPVAEVVRPVG